MPRTRVVILQIGDVHFPEASRGRSDVDLKDASFPSALIGHLGGNALQAVTRSVQAVISSNKCDAIVLMGDLTSRGDKQAFWRCLQFLEQAFLRKGVTPILPDRMVVIPGNHDVNREDAKSPNLEEKFDHINALLNKAGMPEIKIDRSPVIRISKGAAALRIFGTNTCVGCGTLRWFPDLVREKLITTYDAAIAEAMSDSDQRKILDDLYETLDTPMVVDALIASLHDQIKSTNDFTIVSGHHNLVPQATPRIAPYAEMINCGRLRDALLGTRRKVIYLHGHVHDDPIHVITNPNNKSGALISIGAPLMTDGFNLIEIEFAASTSSALGCRVRKYRLKNGVVAEQPSTEIPLALDEQTTLSEDHRKMLEFINEKRMAYGWEVLEKLKFAQDRMEEIADDLTWQNKISVERYSGVPQWVFKRAY